MITYTENSPVPAPQVQFIPGAGRPREQAVALDWPFTYGERRVEQMLVRRMTTAQVEAFIEASKIDGNAIPPMLYFVEGDLVPDDVIAAMEDDDSTKLWEVISGFLPRRLRQVAEPIPPSGEATGSPSQVT